MDDQNAENKERRRRIRRNGTAYPIPPYTPTPPYSPKTPHRSSVTVPRRVISRRAVAACQR